MRKMSKLLVILLALVLLLTACSTAKKEVEYAQGVTEDTIKVGTVAVREGVLAFIGEPYLQGMEAYFKMINDQGGVNGRKIQLIHIDDEFNPVKALEGVEKLIYDEKVFAIVGQLGTPGVLASADVVKEVGIPSVYFGSGATELTKLGDNFFPVQPNYQYEGKLKAKFAVEKFKAEKVVILYQNDDVGRDGLKGFKDGLAGLGKSDILKAELAFAATDTDFSVQIQRINEIQPDLIIIYALSGGVTNFLKEAEDHSINIPMLTSYSNADASFLALASPGAPNAILNLHVLGWLDVNEESLKPLKEAMAKYFPNGSAYNAYTMAGWVAAETFVAGLREAGDDLTWEGYIKAMERMVFTEGLAPEISYKPGVRQGVTKMAMSRVIRLENGFYAFELVTDFIEY
ncbi:ABC transporter substrate-binding protein [Anaerobranca gottschalkii]|uniref:ABC-type branched-chain amino acid transport system, substrate-binding protein n=1 Tax=Anaerobranca gottschalkii DSM 13577 TaxID=1120990 RepID=A0A1I0ADX6_9FIRM|nr:ABC transporter substrate-binding protein [Anaerobranca gottschalkii]SES92394.1 ABC-type branched-chain amino acid transport system, substrate-binding protein [Anaerobranca gottschalkii DSM 13577]